MISRQTLFISDIHLDENHPRIAEQFLQLLRADHRHTDALYILGDLFEVWIGDDDDSPFHQRIMHALRVACDSGLKIYFQRGNRDFLIGKKFMRKTGCQLLADETVIDAYGKPLLLMHGDLLCTADVKYLRARKFAYHPVVQFLFLALPLSLRKKIANNMRAKSMNHTQRTAVEIMDVSPDEVLQKMLQHNVTHLIHGHTHKPAFHRVNDTQQRIVLPAWHDKGRVLIWNSVGAITLCDLDF